MQGRKNVAVGFLFLALFMATGFILGYMHDLAPGKEQWIAEYGAGTRFELRLAHNAEAVVLVRKWLGKHSTHVFSYHGNPRAATEGSINCTKDGGRQGIGRTNRLQRRDGRSAMIAPVDAAVHQVPKVSNR